MTTPTDMLTAALQPEAITRGVQDLVDRYNRNPNQGPIAPLLADVRDLLALRRLIVAHMGALNQTERR